MATFHPVTMNSLKPLTPSINAEANHKEEQFIKSTETILATGNKLNNKWTVKTLLSRFYTDNLIFNIS